MPGFEDDDFIASAFRGPPPRRLSAAEAESADAASSDAAIDLPPAARSEPLPVAPPGPTPSQREVETEEFHLAPPVGRSAAELSAEFELPQRRAVVDRFEADEAESEPWIPQFSLRQLMEMVAVAAVGFAVLRLVRPDLFAGLLGIAAIAGLAFLSLTKPERAIFYLAWWTLLAMYVIVSVFAVVGS